MTNSPLSTAVTAGQASTGEDGKGGDGMRKRHSTVPDPPMKERCEKCRFWDRDDDNDPGPCQCRRHAPVFCPEYWHFEECPENADHGLWPFTYDDSWCGEFQHKEPAP